jgi:DNA-nicking Smr family endonuclease
MNIGDKVRLVHGKEEGVIYAFLPGNVVEIEIEDGFRIPVLRNEIVTISPVEAQRMQRLQEGVKIAPQSDKIVSRQAVFADKGIYIAFVSINDRAVILHLINNTDWLLPFNVTSQKDNVHAGVAAGLLQPRSSQKLTELQMKDFELWPTFEFTILYHRDGNFTKRLPLDKKLKARAQSFYKSKKTAPVLGKEAFVYQLDEEEVVKKEEVKVKESLSEELRASLMGGGTVEKIEVGKPEPVIDLHIQKLSNDYSRLSNDEILKKQLSAFESGMELAIANGMDEITFIHGVGNGVLRNELHRQLSKHQHVQYFKDAQKEKFGYGATLVKFK